MTHTIKRITMFVIGLLSSISCGLGLASMMYYFFTESHWFALAISIEFIVLSFFGLVIVREMERTIERKVKAPSVRKRKASSFRNDAKRFITKLTKKFAYFINRDAQKKYHLMRMFMVRMVIHCPYCNQEVETYKMLGSLIDDARRTINLHDEKITRNKTWYYLPEQFRGVCTDEMCLACDRELTAECEAYN